LLLSQVLMYGAGAVRGYTRRGGSGRARARAAGIAFAFALALAVHAGTTSAQNAAPASVTPAAAPPPAASALERRVLGVEDAELIIDLTSKDGATAGDDVEIFRPVRLVHPVTHQVVVDRYRLGTLRLVQVREKISVARAVAPLLHPAAVGDIIVMERAPAAAPPVPQLPASGLSGSVSPPAPVAAPGAPAAPAVTGTPAAPADSAAVSALFDQLRGTSLTTRVRRYEAYAVAHPESRYTRALLEEAAALRELVSLREHTEADAPTLRHFDVPGEAEDRSPLMLTIELSGRAAGAVLHARVGGEAAYRTYPMYLSGPKYFSVTLPADRVLSPRVEYFVEAVRPSGEAAAVAGSGDAPLTTAVHHVPHPGVASPRETSVNLSTDYADYNRLRGNDHVWQTEGAFRMRFSDVGVRSLGSGFGVYRGVGGSIRDLDELGLHARSVGLTYGYVEGEFGIKPTLSLIARAVLGLRDVGTAGGAQLHFRVGSDQATNLTVGGEVLGGVGLRGIIQLEIEPRGRVPIMVRSEVTNQPAGSGVSVTDQTSARGESVAAGDVGVRGIIQVGYRFVPPLVIALRASYQGRTISHAGPGIGGAIGYQW
jgi:hypothetical protein